MTSTPAQHTIASATAILIAAVLAAGAAPSLRAQGISPAQGSPFSGDFSSPLAQGAASAQAAASAQGAPLPSALAPALAGDAGDGMMDDGAQAPLAGSIDGGDYIAPLGTYRIRIPVYPELGGQVNDTVNVATFQDAFGEHYSIGVFPMNNDFRVEEAKRGHKDFLVWFFQNFIQADFLRTIPATTAAPNARYNATTQGGALFTVLLIPDGSVYAERVFVFPPKEPVVAKRGNLVFARDGFIYVLSTELTERIFEYSTWKKTAAEEEDILRQRLYDLLSRIVFTKPGASAPAPAKPAAPAVPAAPNPTPAPMPAVSYPARTTTGTGAPAK